MKTYLIPTFRRRTAFLFCLLLLPFTSLLAQTLQGTLVDSLTGEPVGFAHIYSKSRDFGTISNEQGKFELKPYAQSDSFYISHVNYQPVFITAAPGDSVTIALKPDVRILDAVVIDQEAIEIATDVYEQLKNAPLFYGKSFYRQITIVDEDPIEFAEVFYDISYKTTGIQEVKIDQARFARKRDKLFQFVNFSYFTNAMTLISDSLSLIKIPFSKVFDDYIYSITEKYIKDGDTYVRVKCTPPKITIPSDTADLYVGSGFLYNLTDRGLMEWHYHIKHGFGADQFENDTYKAYNPEHFLLLQFHNDRWKNISGPYQNRILLRLWEQ
jgi:hypothetical protein